MEHNLQKQHRKMAIWAQPENKLAVLEEMQLCELGKTGVGITMRKQKQQVTVKATGLWIRHLMGAGGKG